MTNIDVIKRKLSEIEKYFTIIKKYQSVSQQEIFADDTLKGAVERYLYLLCQTAIDLAEAAVVHFKLRTPATYGEIFEILAENGLIGKDLSLKMKKMTGFRNILVHAYGEINQGIFYQILTKDINDISLFLEEIKKKLSL